MRTIVHDHRFDQELNAIEPDPMRADDRIAGLEWILARDPKSGSVAAMSNGVEVWMLEGHLRRPLLPVAIYYCFNEAEVHVLSVCRRRKTAS